ncbi:hypothetical protein BY996DRAFT_4576031 [Phakopsora pachyrhizi]|uniref:Uncharacterized protein n=1 Tax=Phakopsora pachyrhizi TaxID=170000 RepID=A0AAV0BN84_PHAPC|nr:hypothetical protein BY996DRAFT_4576031 [Phakopsora pachyrhizi]CAH7688756.1 hypothetical protein PPACK8108_LOCUS23765 [Phakopsora pachyrhizi]
MGATVVARVEGLGIDSLRLLTDRLSREYQASAIERWACIIRSYRQIKQPAELTSLLNSSEDNPEGGIDDGGRARLFKQRAMYTLRHSGMLTQIIVMVEDPNAPKRSSEILKNNQSDDQNSRSSPVADISSNNNTTSNKNDMNDSQQQPKIVEEELKNIDSTDTTEPVQAPAITPIDQAKQQTKPDDGSDSDPSTPGDEPLIGTHYQTSVIALPDTFELLISTTLCSTQTIQPPSSWMARPSIVLIEGKVYGLYSDPMSLEESLYNGDSSGPGSGGGRFCNPDWLLRIGTVTNKGSATSNIALPWLIVELEYLGSDELDSKGLNFLEELLKMIVRPDEKMKMRIFRPNEEDLIDAGLESDVDDKVGRRECVEDGHLPKAIVSRRSGYCIMMLAKQEGLI